MNFGYAAAASAIRTHFAAQWGDRTQIEWPNDPIDPNPDMRAWVRFALDWVEGNRINIGSPAFHRIPGMVTIQVFTAQGTGEGFGEQLADAASSIFGNLIMDAGGLIRFRTPSIASAGQDGVWWQQNVTCAFTRDVTG